jgi:hypothetical protein
MNSISPSIALSKWHSLPTSSQEEARQICAVTELQPPRRACELQSGLQICVLHNYPVPWIAAQLTIFVKQLQRFLHFWEAGAQK